jgi:eukaryotic-like serine/threonine-protein kinase
MGEVWRADDEVLRRTVAVKLLRPEFAENADALARFRAEARHTAALAHPGIAQIYDYGEPEPPLPPFLIMEFVDGPAVSRLLDSGPLVPGTVMDLVAQAADGLAAAHAAGLVHRDIKPGNLLVAADGIVKITDFGIASAAGLAPITRSGTLVGTPAYLAPERVAGATATPASDLYSLGVVAYECLAGRAPFSGSPMEVALAHRHLSFPPLPADLPPAVTGLVGELTAKDPADRPPSASAVAARARQIAAALSGAPADLPAADDWPAGRPGSGGPGSWRPKPVGAAMPAVAAEARTLTDFDLDYAAGNQSGEPVPMTRRARPSGGRLPAGRLAVLAVIGLIVVIGAVLLGQLVGGSGGRPAASGTHHSPVKMISVDSAALVGQPVRVVVDQLRDEGLTVHVVWQQGSGQGGDGQGDGQQGNGPQPGTVLSVQPSGQVTATSTVVVTAVAPYGDGKYQHGHGHGNGNGHGHGNGGGNGQGGD